MIARLCNSSQYFGQYGNLKKVVVNKNYVYKPKGSTSPSYGAYVTYSSPKEAALAILGIEQHEMDDRLLRASFGTTKYCSFFLKGQRCLNKDCLYLHKWHEESETYTKEEMANKKIFADQLEIATKLCGLDTKTKDEFVAEYERNYGKIVTETRFPNILQIIDKYSRVGDKKGLNNEQKTPNKVSKKHEKLKVDPKIKKEIEETKSQHNLSSSEKPRISNQQELQHKTHIEIENKIHEANIMAMNRESKKEEMALSKNKSQILHPYSKIMKCETMNPYILNQMHQNPHMQIDPRRREIDSKRALSSSRDKVYQMVTHSPSDRQLNTFERYQLFGFSEDSKICKTPQTVVGQEHLSYMISPYFFNRNTESRFNFAKSMDPKEETVSLQIPQKIQEILEKNIRTMSNKAHKNSIEDTTSTDIIDFQEDWSSTMEKNRFEDERMLSMASRRSSPHHFHPRYNLSPKSELNKKPGSLSKRDGNEYICSASNKLYSRSSIHSNAECNRSEAVGIKYDSETTSNNEHLPDHIRFTIDFNLPSHRSRK